jgi:hypothetical protein
MRENCLLILPLDAYCAFCVMIYNCVVFVCEGFLVLNIVLFQNIVKKEQNRIENNFNEI